MAPPKSITALLFLFIASSSSQQPPYYFNPFQSQPHRFQQNPYQPFSNAPPYYQPTYQSHSPDGSNPGSQDLVSNYFTGDLPSSSPPASSPLVTFPTQVSTIRGAPNSGQHLSTPQVYQPIGNSIYQQTPTSPTTPAHFRPSPLINHNHHIVNGLPKQQFFGNNYEFFRQRHGLTNLPPTSGPFGQQFQNNAVSSPPLPSPTPSILLSPTSTVQPASKASETKSNTSPAVKSISDTSPKPTQPTIVSRFPSFNSLSPFSPVSTGVGHFTPMVGPGPLQLGPVPFGAPLSSVPSGGAALPGPVFRVGPRGRLLRRKVRPRTQQPNASTPPTTQESQPSPSSPSPSSPPVFQEIRPVQQEISSVGPSHLPPLYSPTPFIPTSVPFPVTTFRPVPQNLLVQQNLVADEQDDDRRVVQTPATFRSRFRFSPSRPTTSTQASIEDEEDENSNQYESEEEAPVVPQRRRPQFSTTTSTTETPSSNQVLSDRANILQRQIRFNRNRKVNNQRNNNS